jgi:hypothetical protein
MAPQQQDVFHAVIFDSARQSDSSEPLIEHGYCAMEGNHDSASTPVPNLSEKMFSTFKWSSLFLGLLVGFFIQFSTLGANFLVITIWGEEVVTKSKQDIILFSLMWSFFTSAMAIVILGFLRNLVSITFKAVSGEKQEEDDSKASNSLLEEMVLHMECRFVVGALMGVCFAWTMTDILLGMKAQIMYSIITLVVALTWCRSMMWFFARSSSVHQPAVPGSLLVV